MKVKPITSIDTALRLFYQCPELNNAQIRELFGDIGNSTMTKYKRAAQELQAEEGVLTSQIYSVNTEIAYKAWGIDVNHIDTMSEMCICIDWSSSRFMIIGNVCSNAADSGIRITANGENCVNNLIIGNQCLYSAKNIDVRGSHNVVSGNHCKYSDDADYTIYVTGSNNLIVNNYIWGKNYTSTGSGNTFANNKYN